MPFRVRDQGKREVFGEEAQCVVDMGDRHFDIIPDCRRTCLNTWQFGDVQLV